MTKVRLIVLALLVALFGSLMVAPAANAAPVVNYRTHCKNETYGLDWKARVCVDARVVFYPAQYKSDITHLRVRVDRPRTFKTVGVPGRIDSMRTQNIMRGVGRINEGMWRTVDFPKIRPQLVLVQGVLYFRYNPDVRFRISVPAW